MKALALIALLLSLSHCNMWDNIYSQTLADTPIILSESLNFQFKLRDNLNARLDFNAELQTVTLFIYLNVVVKMELLRAQLDLGTMVVTIMRINSKECERYNIAAIKGVALEQRKVSKERLFLVNIFFKFIGKTQPAPFKKTVYNIYKLEPFLITAPSSSKFKELQEQMKEKLPDEVDFDEDYRPEVHLYLHINSESGNLENIYSGEKMETKVPFSTVSSIRAKYSCDSEIHSMSSSDLKGIFDFIQQQNKQNKKPK